jgi:beta-phosphoglucomutase-like phosphatase (HAD superfamily)
MGASVAVLLDIEGTLVDTNYFHALAWYRAFRQEEHPDTLPASPCR